MHQLRIYSMQFKAVQNVFGLKKQKSLKHISAAVIGIDLPELPAAATGRAAHPPIAFHKWIAGQTERCDPVGDVALDVVEDIRESRRKLKEERLEMRQGLFPYLAPCNEEEQLSLKKTVAKYKEEWRWSRCPRRKVRFSQQLQQWIWHLSSLGACEGAKEAFNEAFTEYSSAMARLGYHEQ
jgi:hypothetical protein